MNDIFNWSLKFTMRWEGGSTYTNDPDDPGGETKFGISKRAYPDLDIANLTEEEAHKIYYRDYWLKAGCDNYDPPLACSLFDAAVNVGVRRALGWKEQTNGVEAFNFMREHYYNKLVEKKPTLKKYIKGWMNRLNSLRGYINGL